MPQALRNALVLVVGGLAGAATCGLVLPYLAAVTVARPRRGQEPGLAWGPAMIAVPCVGCGGVVGAVVGAAGAARWLNRRGW